MGGIGFAGEIFMGGKSMEMITSISNSQVKHVMKLQKKSRARKEEGLFLVEGVKMYREAPREWIWKTFVSREFLEKQEAEVLEGRKFEVVENQVFKAMADTQTPQGILSILKMPSYRMEDFLRQKNPLLMILENIQDPGNLGTILRTGEGAGITGVLMSRETVDIFNPKTIRSTMGSIYRVPFLYAESLPELVQKLDGYGVVTYAAHLKGTEDYDEKDYRKGTAFLIGNEGNGLSERLARAAKEYIRIPMAGEVESLNAAVASSILMYEAARQRRSEKAGKR